jgi:AbrB family looped-hinge helix DNA binding protein
MSITTVTRKGQVTIPKQVRKALGLKEKDRVAINIEGEKAVIRKVPSLLEMQGSVKVPRDVKGLTWKQIERRAHTHQAMQAAETRADYSAARTRKKR